jgi:hypothetical protein
MAKDYAKYHAKHQVKRLFRQNNSGRTLKKILILIIMAALFSGWFYFNKINKAGSLKLRKLKRIDVTRPIDEPQFDFYTILPRERITVDTIKR